MVLQSGSIKTARNDSSRADRRHVSIHHWQMLRKLQSNLMSPQDFYAKWDVTHKQIASICFCCDNTVDNWFVRTSKRREPSLIHKLLLGIANKLWTDISNSRSRNI
jgi:hypothetical protein